VIHLPKERLSLHFHIPGSVAFQELLALKITPVSFDVRPQGGDIRLMSFDLDADPKHPKLETYSHQRACLQCHHTGGMPIVPKEGTKPISWTPGKTGEEVLAAINKQYETTANSRPDGDPSPGGFPGFGPVNPESRDDAFVEACAKGASEQKWAANLFLTQKLSPLPQTRFPAIRRAMNCQGCHNDIIYSSIRFPVGSDDHLKRKLLKEMIESGHMPPHENGETPLSEDERKILFQCLMAEYFGGMKNEDYVVIGGKNDGVFLNYLKNEKACSPRKAIAH
jgi:hypothetical protein